MDARSPTQPIIRRHAIDGILESTGDPAYSVDACGQLSGWNRPAENLLGRSRESVLGRRCHDVLQGMDIFGNRYCEANCPLLTMARQRTPMQHFQMDVRRQDREPLRVLCFPLRIPHAPPSTFSLVHLLRPADTRAQPFLEPERGARRCLTARELTVLRLLADDHATDEIAALLSISRSTVRKHIQNIFEKLEVHSRLGAVMAAFERRIL